MATTISDASGSSDSVQQHSGDHYANKYFVLLDGAVQPDLADWIFHAVNENGGYLRTIRVYDALPADYIIPGALPVPPQWTRITTAKVEWYPNPEAHGALGPCIVFTPVDAAPPTPSHLQAAAETQLPPCTELAGDTTSLPAVASWFEQPLTATPAASAWEPRARVLSVTPFETPQISRRVSLESLEGPFVACSGTPGSGCDVAPLGLGPAIEIQGPSPAEYVYHAETAVGDEQELGGLGNEVADGVGGVFANEAVARAVSIQGPSPAGEQHTPMEWHDLDTARSNSHPHTLSDSAWTPASNLVPGSWPTSALAQWQHSTRTTQQKSLAAALERAQRDMYGAPIPPSARPRTAPSVSNAVSATVPRGQLQPQRRVNVTPIRSSVQRATPAKRPAVGMPGSLPPHKSFASQHGLLAPHSEGRVGHVRRVSSPATLAVPLPPLGRSTSAPHALSVGQMPETPTPKRRRVHSGVAEGAALPRPPVLEPPSKQLYDALVVTQPSNPTAQRSAFAEASPFNPGTPKQVSRAASQVWEAPTLGAGFDLQAQALVRHARPSPIATSNSATLPVSDFFSPTTEAFLQTLASHAAPTVEQDGGFRTGFTPTVSSFGAALDMYHAHGNVHIMMARMPDVGVQARALGYDIHAKSKSASAVVEELAGDDDASDLDSLFDETEEDATPATKEAMQSLSGLSNRRSEEAESSSSLASPINLASTLTPPLIPVRPQKKALAIPSPLKTSAGYPTPPKVPSKVVAPAVPSISESLTQHGQAFGAAPPTPPADDVFEPRIDSDELHSTIAAMLETMEVPEAYHGQYVVSTPLDRPPLAGIPMEPTSEAPTLPTCITPSRIFFGAIPPVIKPVHHMQTPTIPSAIPQPATLPNSGQSADQVVTTQAASEGFQATLRHYGLPPDLTVFQFTQYMKHRGWPHSATPAAYPSVNTPLSLAGPAAAQHQTTDQPQPLVLSATEAHIYSPDTLDTDLRRSRPASVESVASSRALQRITGVQSDSVPAGDPWSGTMCEPGGFTSGILATAQATPQPAGYGHWSLGDVPHVGVVPNPMLHLSAGFSVSASSWQVEKPVKISDMFDTPPCVAPHSVMASGGFATPTFTPLRQPPSSLVIQSQLSTPTKRKWDSSPASSILQTPASDKSPAKRIRRGSGKKNPHPQPAIGMNGWDGRTDPLTGRPVDKYGRPIPIETLIPAPSPAFPVTPTPQRQALPVKKAAKPRATNSQTPHSSTYRRPATTYPQPQTKQDKYKFRAFMLFATTRVDWDGGASKQEFYHALRLDNEYLNNDAEQFIAQYREAFAAECHGFRDAPEERRVGTPSPAPPLAPTPPPPPAPPPATQQQPAMSDREQEITRMRAVIHDCIAVRDWAKLSQASQILHALETQSVQPAHSAPMPNPPRVQTTQELKQRAAQQAAQQYAAAQQIARQRHHMAHNEHSRTPSRAPPVNMKLTHTASITPSLPPSSAYTQPADLPPFGTPDHPPATQAASQPAHTTASRSLLSLPSASPRRQPHAHSGQAAYPIYSQPTLSTPAAADCHAPEQSTAAYAIPAESWPMPACTSTPRQVPQAQVPVDDSWLYVLDLTDADVSALMAVSS